jgi:hypothetical protein
LHYIHVYEIPIISVETYQDNSEKVQNFYEAARFLSFYTCVSQNAGFEL